MQGTIPGARRRERPSTRPGWTTSIRGQDSQWKSQSEWQRIEINGESTSMVWPTVGSRTAKNRTELIYCQIKQPNDRPQAGTSHFSQRVAGSVV